jgi:S1-C subfamily serine protease
MVCGTVYFLFVEQKSFVNSCVLVYNEKGHGSGVIISKNCVLTAKHVAIEPDLKIRTQDGVIYSVDRVALDPDSDLAFLYINVEFEERPLQLNQAPLKVGDKIVLVGTPYDRVLMNCVLEGRVVNVDMDDPLGHTNVDMIDSHGGPGCSGGPILDQRGRVRAILVTRIGALCGAVPVGELTIE